MHEHDVAAGRLSCRDRLEWIGDGSRRPRRIGGGRNVGECVGPACGRIDGSDVVNCTMPLGNHGVIACHMFAHPAVCGRLFHLGPVQRSERPGNPGEGPRLKVVVVCDLHLGVQAGDEVGLHAG